MSGLNNLSPFEKDLMRDAASAMALKGCNCGCFKLFHLKKSSEAFAMLDFDRLSFLRVLACLVSCGLVVRCDS